MYCVGSGASRKFLSVAIIRNGNKSVSRTDGLYNRDISTQNYGSSANFSKAKHRRRYDKNAVLKNGHMTEKI